MERFYVNYSEKNIFILSNEQYKIHLISKVENFIKKMHWKALQFLEKLQSTDKETFGFHSKKCPPAVEELTNFESDLMLMIKNIQFRHISSTFQKQLKKDVKEIRQSNQFFVSADKSRNIYKMNKENYKNLMHENFTKTYKKTNESRIKTINISTKKIGNRLDLEDRIENLQESESYITIKDHKDDFPHKISFRLINPLKSDIGKISKVIIDKINTKLLEVYKVKQWRNTQSVIDWHINIRSKKNSVFVVFDIENFYPSIPLELFSNTIKFISEKCTISENDLSIIIQSRQTLLFQDKQP